MTTRTLCILFSLLTLSFFSACRAEMDRDATRTANPLGDATLLEQTMNTLPPVIDHIDPQHRTAYPRYRERQSEPINFSYQPFGFERSDIREWQVEMSPRDVFTFREDGRSARVQHQRLTRGFTIIYRIQNYW